MTQIDHKREEIRQALLSIAVAHQGVLNPRDVLDAARDPDHVLHDRFEWDDAIAAESYRLEQAGALIRRIKVTVIRPDQQEHSVRISTTRGYQSRPSMRDTSGGYEALEELLSDEDKRRELLAQVLRDLTAYRRRYSELNELQAVWIAVDEAVSDQASSVVAPETDDSRPSAAS